MILLLMMSLIFVHSVLALSVFFFFQAEDGIRDYKVTGVQTCALPIFARAKHHQREQDDAHHYEDRAPRALGLGFLYSLARRGLGSWFHRGSHCSWSFSQVNEGCVRRRPTAPARSAPSRQQSGRRCPRRARAAMRTAR